MPNAKLPAAQLDRIRADLETRRAALRVEVKAQLRGSGDDRVVGLSNRLNENDDWAVADALAELDIAGATHVLNELAEVDAALARIRGGDYGLCTDCGDPIAPADSSTSRSARITSTEPRPFLTLTPTARSPSGCRAGDSGRSPSPRCPPRSRS